jgi:hypothetical protein
MPRQQQDNPLILPCRLEPAEATDNTRKHDMKVSIEIDLTPTEARELMGMPNMTGIQEMFVGMAKDKLEKTTSLVDLEPMLKTWTGIGGVAQDAFGAIVGAALKAATSDTGPRTSSKPAASSGFEKPDSDKPA